MADQEKKSAAPETELDKLEVEELDDSALEGAAGGTGPIQPNNAPNGVQCQC